MVGVTGSIPVAPTIPDPRPGAAADVLADATTTGRSGALTQTEDKAGIAAECLRVLKPGGLLTCND